ELKRAAVDAGIKDPATLSVLSSVLKERVPEQQTLAEVVRGRLGNAHTKAAFLSGLTFEELVSLTKQLRALPRQTVDSLERIRSIRNSVAHFRRVSLDEAMAVSREIRDILQVVLKDWQVG